MSILESIGNTPLVELKKVWDADATGVRILAKLEGVNPSGSVKDRPAYRMIKNAIDAGILTKDKTIIEPTSGNTGIGLAMIAAHLGYRIKLVMPACVSEERRAILLAYAAELELTPGSEKTDGAIRRAHYILEHHADKYFMPNQYDNDANWQAHYDTTAPEILQQSQGFTVFAAGMGTSGTLMGCSRYFKDKKCNVKVIGVEPVLDHRIQGLKNMKESIVPKIFDPSLLDERVICEDEAAFETARELAEVEGIFCGISSGAALYGAMEIARDLPRGSTVVTLFPDRGDRYLSTELFRSVCANCPP
jgi:S-sulfo-L-cysteine synthase (O-acetyl-L-serine-dependent)